MVICPIALAVGCKRCPAFSVCPVKSVIGDYKPDAHDDPPADKPARAGRSTSLHGEVDEVESGQQPQGRVRPPAPQVAPLSLRVASRDP